MLNSHRSASQPRILVAGNHDVVQAVSNARRNGEACETQSAADGVAAMHTLLGGAFDLVIIDLAMCRLDGLRLIALIRATPALKHLPVLVIASLQKPASSLEGLRAGANDYLARPIEWPLLAMRIRQLTAN